MSHFSQLARQLFGCVGGFAGIVPGQPEACPVELERQKEAVFTPLSREQVKQGVSVRQKVEEALKPLIGRINEHMGLPEEDDGGRRMRLSVKLTNMILDEGLEIRVDMGMRDALQNAAMRRFQSNDSSGGFTDGNGRVFCYRHISGFSFSVPVTESARDIVFYGHWALNTVADNTRDIRVVLNGMDTLYGKYTKGWRDVFPTKEAFVAAVIQPTLPPARIAATPNPAPNS